MEYVIPLNKGEAVPLGNSLRQIALSRAKAWRPIAYLLNVTTSNILRSEDYILEDMIEFASNLTSLTFQPTSQSGSDLVIETYEFSKQLRGRDLGNQFFRVDNPDKILLTSLQDHKITIKVIYRYDFGDKTVSENQEFLYDHSYSDGFLKILSSRHTDLDVIAFDVVNSNSTSEDLKITLKSKIGNESEIMSNSIDIIEEALRKIKNVVKNSDA